MKRLVFTLALCVTASTAQAQQRIQDMSMTPEETGQAAASGAFQSDVTQRAEKVAPAYPPLPGGNEPIPSPPSKSFMDSYCNDPSFISILANNRKYFGQEECLKRIRDNGCGRFKALPPEVQHVVDDAIGCLFANGNGYVIDRTQPVSNDSVMCGASYMQRIELLKKYSGDYYANNALIYLPDDVMDTPGRCVNRNDRQPVLVK